jgi:hypothetical protein
MVWFSLQLKCFAVEHASLLNNDFICKNGDFENI